MIAKPLPPDRVSPDEFGNDNLCCPWCAAFVDDVKVALGDLFWAQQGGQLTRPNRDAHGRPEAGALQADCLECARPFMIAMRRVDGAPHMRLLAIRTAADASLLERGV